MRNRLIGSFLTLALSAPLGLAATASAADAATTSYSSCSALTQKFAHGVSSSRKAALRQVRAGYGMPAYGPFAQKVYRTNHSRLDRDKDGTACER